MSFLIIGLAILAAGAISFAIDEWIIGREPEFGIALMGAGSLFLIAGALRLAVGG